MEKEIMRKEIYVKRNYETEIYEERKK